MFLTPKEVKIWATKVRVSKYFSVNFVVTDKEYQRYQGQIHWYKSLSDAYQKLQQNESYFYVRNQNFVAVFRKSKGKTIAQVIPSTAMNQAILDHPNLKFEVKKTILEKDDSDAEQPFAEASEDDDIDIEADKINPNINFQK